MSNNPLVDLDKRSKPATVFVEKISEVIGDVFESYQIQRSTEEKAARTRAQFDIEMANLQSMLRLLKEETRSRHNMESITAEAVSQSMLRLLKEEIWNQHNMESITAEAMSQLNEEANPEDMDDDWVANFFHKVQIVSDSEMQGLWSKILAGEANFPGHFSKRTVNCVSELEKTEVNLFNNLCGFGWKFGNNFRPLVFDETAEIYNECGINSEALDHLDSIGLVQFNPIAGYKHRNMPEAGNVFYYDRPLPLRLGMPNYREDNEIGIGKVILTDIGEQLALICNRQPVEGFYEYVKNHWEQSRPLANIMTSEEGDLGSYIDKFYVCFDSDSDIHYYWLMRAWEQDNGTKFNFFDAYDLNTAYNVNFEETVKRQLKARLQDTQAFVILIGESTRYPHPLVKWQIEEALALDLPIICVNLNGLRHRDAIRCPSIIGDSLSVHIGFNPVILEHALQTWPEKHYALRQQGDSSPYYYKQSDYSALGLGTSDQQSHFENRADSEDEFSKKVPVWKWHSRLRRTK